MLIREFISAVRNNLDSISLDNYKSGEYIYYIGVSIASLLMKRESDSRKIFKNTSQFKWIYCVELEESNNISCSNITLPKCKKFMKSKKPIPKSYTSAYGSLLFVYNLTRDKDYIEINPILYKNITNQKYKSTKGYFWIENDYLVIPDSEVEVVDIYGLFESTTLSDTNSTSTSSCGKILDEKFPCLDYLIGSVIELTTKQLLTNVQINKDENSNLNEGR